MLSITAVIVFLMRACICLQPQAPTIFFLPSFLWFLYKSGLQPLPVPPSLHSRLQLGGVTKWGSLLFSVHRVSNGVRQHPGQRLNWDTGRLALTPTGSPQSHSVVQQRAGFGTGLASLDFWGACRVWWKSQSCLALLDCPSCRAEGQQWQVGLRCFLPLLCSHLMDRSFSGTGSERRAPTWAWAQSFDLPCTLLACSVPHRQCSFPLCRFEFDRRRPRLANFGLHQKPVMEEEVVSCFHHHLASASSLRRQSEGIWEAQGKEWGSLCPSSSVCVSGTWTGEQRAS